MRLTVGTGSFPRKMEQRQLPDLMFLLGLLALIYHGLFTVIELLLQAATAKSWTNQ